MRSIASRLSRLGLGMVMLVSGFLGISSAVMSGAATAATTTVPAPACPADWTCTELPNNGGMIQIGPTQHVTEVGGSQPWVFLRGYGLHPGDAVRIHYCSLNQTLAQAAPVCATTASGVFQTSPSASIYVLDDGTIAESTQVPLDDPTSGQPIHGNVPGRSGNSTFYCDGAANQCGIVVTDGNLANPYTNTPTPQNSAAFPISYDLSSVACPNKQTLIPSESEFGIGPLLPTVDRLNCTTSAAYNFFNTEQSGVSAVHDLYENVRSTSPYAIRVAFTDDPQDPNQQKYLPAGHFVLIPMALSATVVGFNSQMYNGGRSFPQTSYNLTPNMVAGIFSNAYTGPNPDTDFINCTGTCPSPPCVSATVCSLLQLATAHNGYYTAKSFIAYPAGYQSGPTDHLTHWICNAPAATVPLALGGTAAESKTGAQVFLDSLKAFGHPYSSCPAQDQWPSEVIPSTQDWVEGVSPSDQLTQMNKVLPSIGVGSTADTGFAYMNWAWASYLGLNSAGLLNATNTFVTPTESSLDAALADATLNPDGSYSFNYSDTKSTAAYPLTSVIYAAVSTDTMPDTQKATIQKALSSMLAVTSGKSAAALPQGYVPLTPALTAQATAEIQTAIGNPKFDISTVLPQLKGSTPPPATPGFTPSSFALSAFSSIGFAGILPILSGHVGAVGASAGGLGSLGPVPWSSPLYGPIELTATASRMLVPTVGVLGAIALVLGALLLSWGGISQGIRKLRPTKALDAEATVDGGEGTT